jgi:dTMP kinase
MGKTPLFISFEGGEGAGKTTQINTLAGALTQQGYKVITTREPGGTEEGEKIRALLVQRDGGNWNPMSECLLLFAARIMHVEQVIRPALEAGKIVITDRFTDSTRAYQGYGHGFDLKLIESLNDQLIGGFKPDLTFILDVDPQKGLERSSHRLASQPFEVDRAEDRFENLELEFHKRLRQGFLEIAKKEKDRCRVIDASKSLDAIAKEIEKIVLEKLK